MLQTHWKLSYVVDWNDWMYPLGNLIVNVFTLVKKIWIGSYSPLSRIQWIASRIKSRCSMFVFLVALQWSLAVVTYSRFRTTEYIFLPRPFVHPYFHFGQTDEIVCCSLAFGTFFIPFLQWCILAIFIYTQSSAIVKNLRNINIKFEFFTCFENLVSFSSYNVMNRFLQIYLLVCKWYTW